MQAGTTEIVLSAYAKGPDRREFSARFPEICGSTGSMSKETYSISQIKGDREDAGIIMNVVL